MNKIKIIYIFIIMLLTIPANAANQTTSVEIRGTIANETSISGGFNLSNASISTTDSPVWTPLSFSGFYYDNDYNLGQETLKILSIDERTIPQDKLVYTTQGQGTTLGLVDDIFGSNASDAMNNGLEKFESGQMGPDDGTYNIVGWLGEDYVGIKNKANKLAKLIIEQDSTEKKTLAVGETWDIGGGWTLTAQSIDSKAAPRQAWLVLSKDGVHKDTKVIEQGKVYTYVEKRLGGESDVPLFVTYIDSVFTGSGTDMVQLKYTWAIDTTITEIKSGDKYGVFKVQETDPIIQLNNTDNSVTLDKGATIELMGNIRFKAADSDELRIYPMFEYEIPAGEAIAEVSLSDRQTGDANEIITPAPTETVQEPVVMPHGAARTEPVQSIMPTPTQKAPGFEIGLAISSFMAVTYFLLRQRK